MATSVATTVPITSPLPTLVDYMPSPLDIPHIKGETLDGEPTEAKTSDSEPFAAYKS